MPPSGPAPPGTADRSDGLPIGPVPEVSAIVLAGGGSRRMSGVADKVAADVGGEPIVQRVLAAASAAGADPIVLVGPPRPGVDVPTVLEDPPGGGPLAAVAAGLAEVDTPLVLLLAGDLPFVDAAALGSLLDAVRGGGAGAVAVDVDGRPQWLLSAWRRPALLEAVGAVGDPSGQPLRTALERLVPTRVHLDAPADLPPWFDCDTPDDLARARRAAGPDA